VILDATYSDREHRDILRRQMATAGFSVMWVESVASDATVRDRLRHRNRDRQVISDAREEDFEKLAAGYLAVKEIPNAELISIPTEDTALKTQTDLLQRLVQKNASSEPVDVW
jgi:predicted kinase